MPIVRIDMLAGRSPETKAALIQRITEAVVETLGSQPAQVRVLLNEVAPENWGVAGETMQSRQPAPNDPTQNRGIE
jgi:4-oxalocrotonate tautomerase